MGRLSDAVRAWRGETKAVPGADLVVGTVTTPQLSSVTIDSAMEGAARLSSILAAALTWTARNFAEAPFVQMRDGEALPDSPLSRAFASPTAWHSQTQFWQRVVMLMCTDKAGAYIVAAKDDTGEIGALWPRASRHVRPIMSDTEYIAGWEFIVNGYAQRVDPAKYEIVRLQFPSPEPDDEMYSFTPLEQIRKETRTNVTASLWLDYILQNMGVSSGLIGIDSPGLDQKTAKSVQNEVNERMGGANNGGKFAVVAGKLTYTQVGMKLTDVDFGPLQDRLEVATARAFGLPIELLQCLATVNKGEGFGANAYREKCRIAYTNNVIPLWKDIGSAVAGTLAPLYGLAPSEAAFDYAGVEALREDETVKIDRAIRLLPILEVNEAREVAGYPPVPWGDYNPQASLYSSFGEKSVEVKAAYKDVRGAMWETKARSFEPRFARSARKVFALEADAVASAVESGEDAEGAIDPQRWVDGMKADIAVALATGYDDVYAPLAARAKAGVARGFGIVDEDAVEAALARTVKLSGHVTKTTKDRVREIVAQSIEEGLTPQETAAAIREHAFGGSITTARAMNIARTESLGAMNQGGLIGAHRAQDDLGLTVRKTWLTAGDEDVRDAHAEAAAAGPQPLDSDFGVGAQEPGLFGDPGEDCNCRCVLVYDAE